MRDLQTDPQTLPDDPEEDLREDQVTAARGQIRHVYNTRLKDAPMPVCMPWVYMAERIHRVAGSIDLWREEISGVDSDISTAVGVRVLNDYLRQLLIHCVTIYQYELATDEAAKQAWLRLSGLAMIRAAQELKKNENVSEGLKRQLAAHLSRVWKVLAAKQVTSERRKPAILPSPEADRPAICL